MQEDGTSYVVFGFILSNSGKVIYYYFIEQWLFFLHHKKGL